MSWSRQALAKFRLRLAVGSGSRRGHVSAVRVSGTTTFVFGFVSAAWGHPSASIVFMFAKCEYSCWRGREATCNWLNVYDLIDSLGLALKYSMTIFEIAMHSRPVAELIPAFVLVNPMPSTAKRELWAVKAPRARRKAGARRGHGVGAGRDESIGECPEPARPSSSGSDDEGERRRHREGSGPAATGHDLVDALADAEADEAVALAEEDVHEALAEVCPELDGLWGACRRTRA